MTTQTLIGFIVLALIVGFFGFIATRTLRKSGSPRRNRLYAWPRAFGDGARPEAADESNRDATLTTPATLAELTSRRSEAERIALMRAGIPITVRGELADALGWSREHLDEVLSIESGTALAAPADSERFLLLHDLVLEVAAMVRRSGNPEKFDAGRWLGRWLDQPNPALGAKPAHWLDTCAGCFMVANVLACMESGVYR